MTVNPINYVKSSYQGVRLLDTKIFDVLDKVLEGLPFTAEYSAVFKAWCEEYQVTYYGKPDCSFDVAEAIQQAVTNKSRYLLLDNLS